MDIGKVILVLWTITSDFATQGDDFGPECEYKGNMRNISVENCIVKMEEKKCVEECRGIEYAKLYIERDDIPFRINIASDARKDYPNDLTYKILNLPVFPVRPKKYADLKPIDGCESLKLDGMDNCILPKLETSDETNWVYMPLLDNPENFSYCSWEIQETEGAIEYCFGDKPKLPCYEFKDGRYFRREAFLPVDSEWPFPSIMQYCFFPVSHDYFDTRENWDDFGIQPNIKSQGTGENISALLRNETVRCRIKKINCSEDQRPLQDIAQDFRGTDSDIVCYFLRSPKENKNWTPNASCLKVKHLPGEPIDNIEVIFIVSFPLIVALFIIVCAVWLYKKHLVQCTFKKTREEVQKSVAIKKDHLLDCDSEGNTPVQEKEIPFEISFESVVLKCALKPKANEEQIDELTTNPQTQSLMCIDHSQTSAADHKMQEKVECESDEQLRTNTLTDSVSLHNMADECIEVDNVSEKYFGKVFEKGQENLDINSPCKRDKVNGRVEEFDSGYSSKLKEPPLYVEAFNDYRKK